MIEINKKEEIQNIIKEEMNLTEIPFCYPSKRLPSQLKEIIYERKDITKDRNNIKRKITVRNPATEMGERVYLGLMAISKKNGFPQKNTNFSIYKLMEILKMGDCGNNYSKIKRALKELHEVCIYAEEAFWDNKNKRYLTLSEKGFHIIEEWEIRKKGDKEEGYFIWSKTIYKSIVENGYIKNLNFQYYLQLNDALARRLYRYLDKRMYNLTTFEIDVLELSKITGIVNDPHISHIKRRLEPALDELMKTGFINTYEYCKDGKKLKITKPKNLLEVKTKNNNENKNSGEMANELKIKSEKIKELIEEHGKEKIEKIYKYSIKNANINPGGLFLNALEKGYEVKEEQDIENEKKLKIEAERCYKNCFGNCAANLEEIEKMKNKKACYWCVKFSNKKRNM